MLNNYFKIAWRNLLKTKGYSLINIGGLAVGMAVAMLIGLWIKDELSFNKYHSNYGKIAKVMRKGSFGGQSFSSDAVQRPLEGELRNKYGNNFKRIVMARWNEDHILSVGEKKIIQTGRFMQEGAPEMLSLEMIHGNWSGLKDPLSVMLSASVAKALFGNDTPLGKTVTIDNETDVKVTGVYEDLPYNSEFRDIKFLSTLDLTISKNQWMQDVATSWRNQSFGMYVQIQDNITFEEASLRVKSAVQDNVDEDVKKFDQEVFLYPMSQWHLYSEWKNGVNIGGRIQFVWLFAIIGVFVLLLACINFMNLSTARSEKRAKEVGIRKAVGSVRDQLIKQFLCESFLVVLIAFFFAITLVIVFLPWFSELADKKMSMPWSNLYFWLACLTFILITSLVSGSYPAFYLSSFNPVKVLKGTFRAGRSASTPRQVLVVLQFSVSIALIIGTIIVYRQIQHAKNRPIGYDKNSLLMIQMKSADLRNKMGVLKDELKNKGIAVEVALSSSPLTGVWDNNGGIEWRNKNLNKEEGFGTVYISHEYGKTLGWEFVDGRDFSRPFSSDSISGTPNKSRTYSIIINQAAADYMGFNNPVGEIIKMDSVPFKIVGVIKNMVTESPFQPVRQTLYIVDYDDATKWMNIKINPRLSASKAVAEMESIFKKVVPEVPFDYKFADTEYGYKFNAEERIGKLSSVFATLAIFISCLGLFGLASFVAEKRTKEIGVRKVLGASLFNLWKMLSKDFLILVVIACFIAAPLAYYFLYQWLQKYEYRTEMSWWIFAIAIAGAIIITLLTVSAQAIKAGMSNPVKSLRSE